MYDKMPNCKIDPMGNKMPSNTKGMMPMPSSAIDPMGNKMPAKGKGKNNMPKASPASGMGENLKK